MEEIKNPTILFFKKNLKRIEIVKIKWTRENYIDCNAITIKKRNLKRIEM